MKLIFKLINIISVLIMLSIILVSFAYGWYSEIKTNNATGISGSVVQVSDDGLILDEDKQSSAKTYKLHEEIKFKLKSTREFSKITIKVEQQETLSEDKYKKLCKDSNLIYSSYLKNTVSYKAETDENIELMYNMYNSNNILDFYTGTLTSGTSSCTLKERDQEGTTRIFEFEGKTDSAFTMTLKFGNGTYPTYIDTTNSIKYTATTYNCFLIGLNLLITCVAE